jgi:hypothetical protein
LATIAKRGRGIPSVEDRIKCGKKKINGIDLDIDMRDERQEKTTDLVKGSVGCKPPSKHPSHHLGRKWEEGKAGPRPSQEISSFEWNKAGLSPAPPLFESPQASQSALGSALPQG